MTTGPRLDVVSLPNGEFLLMFSAMPVIDRDSWRLEDWCAARETMLHRTGAASVLYFDHPVAAPERTETT